MEYIQWHLEHSSENQVSNKPHLSWVMNSFTTLTPHTQQDYYILPLFFMQGWANSMQVSTGFLVHSNKNYKLLHSQCISCSLHNRIAPCQAMRLDLYVVVQLWASQPMCNQTDCLAWQYCNILSNSMNVVMIHWWPLSSTAVLSHPTISHLPLWPTTLPSCQLWQPYFMLHTLHSASVYQHGPQARIYKYKVRNVMLCWCLQ